MAAPQKRVVTLRYQDLVAGKDLTEEIFEAYGPDGLGALTISGIPGFSQQREELLPLGHTLAHLPEEKLSQLEDAESLWNAGWSYGKEKFSAEPDTSKGSFYANPLYDVAVSEEVRKSNLYAYPKNIWPKEDLPAMEPAFKTLGKTMYEVVVLLTKQIDALVEKRIPGYKKGMLHELISTTKKIKGRLLYYYPVDKSKDKEDGWIGWHNDSGFLTALTSAMFFDDDAAKAMPNPDPMGGLWIVSRGHDNVHVKIPSDHLAVQCGECLQIVTGGLLVATPHCVRPSFSDNVKVGRATFPVFIDSDIHFKLEAPAGRSREDVFEHTARSKVPPLDQRWTHDGMTFSEFLKVSFEQYYTWNLKK